MNTIQLVHMEIDEARELLEGYTAFEGPLDTEAAVQEVVYDTFRVPRAAATLITKYGEEAPENLYSRLYRQNGRRIFTAYHMQKKDNRQSVTLEESHRRLLVGNRLHALMTLFVDGPTGEDRILTPWQQADIPMNFGKNLCTPRAEDRIVDRQLAAEIQASHREGILHYATTLQSLTGLLLQTTDA